MAVSVDAGGGTGVAVGGIEVAEGMICVSVGGTGVGKAVAGVHAARMTVVRMTNKGQRVRWDVPDIWMNSFRIRFGLYVPVSTSLTKTTGIMFGGHGDCSRIFRGSG